MFPMTGDDIKQRTATDFDPCSPKLRLSIITYLLDAGVKENIVTEAQDIVDFVGADIDIFNELIDEVFVNDNDPTLAEGPGDPREDVGYL